MEERSRGLIEEIEEYDPRCHPAQLVRRVHQKAVHLFMQKTSNATVSVTRFVALVTLLKGGPMTQSQLGTAASMDPSTTTAVVRKLEQEGQISKHRSPTDGRASVLKLTDTGRTLAKAHIPVSQHAGEALLEPLTPIERVLFLALLEKVLGDELPPQ